MGGCAETPFDSDIVILNKINLILPSYLTVSG